jgi:hypothetical protein
MQCVRICTRKLAPCDKRRSGGQGVEEESDTVADLRHEVREEIETVRLAIRNLMQLTKQVPWHTCARDLCRSRLRFASSRPRARLRKSSIWAGAVLLSLLHCRAQPWTLRAWRTSASSCTTRSC